MTSLETRKKLFTLLKKCTSLVYPNLDITTQENEYIQKFEEPKEYDFDHNLAFPCYLLAKSLTKEKPKSQDFNSFCSEISQKVKQQLMEHVSESDIVEKVESDGPYINFFFKTTFLALVIPQIINGSFLKPRSPKNENVMIEYSQPNTHKTFHVGHMRNAALGNSLINIYEFNGYHVNAVNYIGDVGAHIAKCLWYYLYFIKKTDIDTLESQKIDEQTLEQQLENDRPKDIPHVEWLGDLYQNGYNQLDMTRWTSLPHPGFISAKIVSIEEHPNNKTWKVLHVVTDEQQHHKYRVVCGGKGYNDGDIIAYAPVGCRKGGRVVLDHDFKGVISQGLVLSEKELEVSDNKDKIYIFPPSTVLGLELTELGRLEGIDLEKELKITEEITKRNAEVKKVLRYMEDGHVNITNLWKITRRWSIDDFKTIYDWVGCRFDHYFHESDVGEESKQIVLKAYEEGKLIKSEGAIGADLSKHKLGFAMLLTSAGTGLYATKDLALAKRKFEEFHVDRSVYVVDASQSLHFQQVFKTLELLGFKQASKCYHLAYGLVVLPEGKMSSRKGNIIFFSKLKELITNKVREGYMEKKRGEWPDDEIEAATRKIAVSTIKYGMLNQDNKKDIVFDLDEWTGKTGNTGPYLMYAYTRTRSIMREVPATEEEKKLVNYAVLTNDMERKVLSTLNLFPSVVERAAEAYKPQYICQYLFTLAKMYSRLYEQVKVKTAETTELKVTRLHLIEAVGNVLRTGLDLLGIETIERM
jgi:arginyl-tRNA synthetase